MKFRNLNLSVILLLLVSCSNEYFDYHSDNSVYEKQVIEVKKYSKDFDISKIPQLDPEVMNLPDKTTLNKIVDNIKNSKKMVYLEVYILTEKRIISELIKAKNRGVDVKVILEKNVLGSPSINLKAFKSLQAAGIEVRYASNKNYVYTHSKFFIIDDSYIIGTGNMSHSTFYKNKEFYIFGSDLENLNILKKVFEDDVGPVKTVYCKENIIVSPLCSRLRFESIFSQAKKSIYIYAQQISDFNIEKIIRSKANEGININIILANPKIVKSNQNIIDKFGNQANILIHVLKKYYVHAKVFIIDNEIIYIGSVNFTANSMDNNREVGMIFKNKKLADDLIKGFTHDSKE